MTAQAVDDAIRVLNEALDADPEAVNRLMNLEVTCNETIADHPSIQVGTLAGRTSSGYARSFWRWLLRALGQRQTEKDRHRLRPLGLINGLFGADEDCWGFICMTIGVDGQITHFDRTPPKMRPQLGAASAWLAILTEAQRGVDE